MSARRTLLHPSSHPAVLVLGLLLAACGGSDSETSTPAESLDVSPTFVGADTPGGSEVFGTVDRGAAGEKDTTEPAGTGDEGAGEGGDGGAQGGVDPGSSTGTDTKLPPIEECVLEVPDHVDMTTPVWGVNNVHFYVPKATWAMAMAHAHRIMENDRVPMSAGAIFATALKESFMGCSKSAPPDSEHEGVAWKHQSHADADGCFQIECATAYSEMKRIFPERFGPTTHAEVISSKGQTEEGGDHFETSALTMAHYNVWAVSMMRRYHPNPRRFLREHPDREAGPKAVAIVYNRGAWSAEIEHVFNACATAPDIADCLDEQVGCSPGATDICDYVRAVGSYTGRLQSHAYHPGTCYDADIGREDVLAYLDNIATLYPEAAETATREAVSGAFDEVAGGVETMPFQQAFPAVLEVIVERLPMPTDPEDVLRCCYGVACAEGEECAAAYACPGTSCPASPRCDERQ